VSIPRAFYYIALLVPFGISSSCVQELSEEAIRIHRAQERIAEAEIKLKTLDDKGAEPLLIEAKTLNPYDKYTAQKLLLGIYLRSGQNAEAVREFRQIHTYNPRTNCINDAGDIRSLVTYGDTCLKLGWLREARAVFNRAAADSWAIDGPLPPLGGDLRVLRSLAYAARATKEEGAAAIADTRHALALAPGNDKIQFFLAATLERQPAGLTEAFHLYSKLRTSKEVSIRTGAEEKYQALSYSMKPTPNP